MSAAAVLSPLPPPPTELAAGAWVCPFCALLCEAADQQVPDCPRARQRLASLALPGVHGPSINGNPASLSDALTAAAKLLRNSRQPLIGGLGVDVAGARALQRLADASGAISDSAQGPALTEGLRTQQDRGGYTTTLAELRGRADLVLCLGGVFANTAPLLFERHVLPTRNAWMPGADRPRQVVVLGSTTGQEMPDATLLAQLASAPGISLQTIPWHGDAHSTVALLCALLAALASGAVPPNAPPALQALAQALRAAHYSVLIGAPAQLPAQAALLMEAAHRCVERLNAHTRAAALWLGGGEGAATTNQVFTWLTGLPLRSRAGPAGLEHQPVVFDAHRLLADGAVDVLLWVSSFDAGLLPPASACPRIVLGPPALGAALAGQAAAGGAPSPTVFLPVTTPGVQTAGDLFRTDGTVLLPLRPLPVDLQPPNSRADLPTAASLLAQLSTALRSAEATS